MEELKPCPFCGSEAEYYSECEMVKVRCSNYDCWCQLVTWKEDAIRRMMEKPPKEET